MTRLLFRVKPRLPLTIIPVIASPLHLRSQEVVCATLLILCTTSIMHSGAALAARTELLVFAASSLTDAFLSLEEDFEHEQPHIDLLFNFAASSTLTAQLLQGAPADVFASADERQMSVVRAAGLADGALGFARNRLVLALPADNPAGLESFAGLAQPGLRLVLAAPGVPIRSYSEQALNRLASRHRFSTSDVLDNVVSEERNVRQVLFKIVHGSADAGFVYRSDITPELAATVRTLPLPASANVNAHYLVAVLANSPRPQPANAFIDFLLSPAGQQHLLRAGFESASTQRVSPAWGSHRPAFH